MIRGPRRTETLFKLGALVFILLLMWTARDYPPRSRLFPELLGIVTGILILISTVQSLFKPKGREMKEDREIPEVQPADVRQEKLRLLKELEEKGDADAGYEFLEEGLRKKRLFQSVLIILISLGIGYVGGFLLTVPFYFLAFGLLHGQRRRVVRTIVIAAGITIVTYLFFTSLMGVPLLRGLWWG